MKEQMIERCIHSRDA